MQKWAVYDSKTIGNSLKAADMVLLTVYVARRHTGTAR